MSKNKQKFVDKSYRLSDDRSGESFLLKTGKNRKLLVFDEDKGFNRPIRHCPNEKSIFIDEQSDHALVDPIIFQFGQLEVPYKNQLTQKFLASHPDNVANGGSWFEEINDEIEAGEAIEQEELILDIKQVIRDKAKEDDGIYALEMVAAVLLDSVVKAGDMGKEELKRVIYQEVDRNPFYFVDDEGEVNIFDDESLQRKYLTLRALKDGILKKSANNKSIMWTKGKKVIATAPQGLDLIDYFADFLSTDDGILVLEEIKRRS